LETAAAKRGLTIGEWCREEKTCRNTFC
jgi:hypothetical protein